MSYKLSNIISTPLPSLHMDFYSRRVVNSVILLIVQLIPLHNIAAFINICRVRLLASVECHVGTPECLLVTMDENSLCTNIPHTDLVEACRTIPTMKTTDQTLINEIRTLVDFILKHNILMFSNKQYLQKMAQPWEKMTSTYANIFTQYVESTFIS